MKTMLQSNFYIYEALHYRLYANITIFYHISFCYSNAQLFALKHLVGSIEYGDVNKCETKTDLTVSYIMSFL